MGRTAVYTLRQIQQQSIAQLLVTRISSADIVDFCLERQKNASRPSPQTLAVDISCLRKVMRVAKSMFNVNVDDRSVIAAYPALHDLKLIARSSRRERRLQGDELQQLLTALKKKESHHACIMPYHDIFLISLLTCCRVGEVCNLRWNDINEAQRTITVRDRKSPNGSMGNHSVLPLLGESLEILLRQPKMNERIFPFKSRSITAGFRATRRRLGISDLRYHDLRREGASRLIELGLSVEETARITVSGQLTPPTNANGLLE
ncbi:site-specific integrase [Psychrobium sp. 1_MG-2023]|uniref:site-specific integrase n=1 Tax=Psychrobium sp. 1_MG-2023 TaxID=3062624 RepID=UPI0027364417|nr:site-specific integrase [Psychrobium sp. 1_MG-2023]MDP2562988.1 site-specific integrase [Psychrobium sp. 1_MG-2023]